MDLGDYRRRQADDNQVDSDQIGASRRSPGVDLNGFHIEFDKLYHRSLEIVLTGLTGTQRGAMADAMAPLFRR